MKPRNLIIGFALIALTVSLPAFAEVSARLDEEGAYSGMVFRITNPARIWTSPAPTFNKRPLNPTGDLLGDLAPTVVESSTADRWPVAVWAHPNGADYDLVFSKWTGRSWTPVSFVDLDNPYNDLDPRIAMNSIGRPYMAWYRAEPSGGAIYFSIFMQSRWMTPIRVSASGVNSSDPQLSLQSDTRATISYMTPSGVQVHTITIPNTDSITDDIDPKIRTQISIN
jgi:hypothetical protein